MYFYPLRSSKIQDNQQLPIVQNIENNGNKQIAKIIYCKGIRMMKYGYARVSTLEQKLENQAEQLRDAGAETIIQEKLTGTTKDRPEFQGLLARLEAGDTLIVTKLDRFVRNTKEPLKSFKSCSKKT